jgi:hypothetical protein
MSSRRSPLLTLFTLLVYAFLYAPIVVLVVFAFNSSRQNVVFEGVVNRGPCGPFYWFCQLANNHDALEAAGNTLEIAVTSTILSTLIGTMAALALQRYRFRLKFVSEVSLYIPIVIPEIVMGISLLVLFKAVFTGLNAALGLAGDGRLELGLGTVIASHIAFSVPWCNRGFTPPRLWLSECTQPRPFWKAIAPCIEALSICQRASRLAPSRVARSMWAQPRCKPSRAMPSAGGLTAGAMKVSMQCAIASMPVAAVKPGGRPTVSSGSSLRPYLSLTDWSVCSNSW